MMCDHCNPNCQGAGREAQVKEKGKWVTIRIGTAPEEYDIANIAAHTQLNRFPVRTLWQKIKFVLYLLYMIPKLMWVAWKLRPPLKFKNLLHLGARGTFNLILDIVYLVCQILYIASAPVLAYQWATGMTPANSIYNVLMNIIAICVWPLVFLVMAITVFSIMHRMAFGKDSVM